MSHAPWFEARPTGGTTTAALDGDHIVYFTDAVKDGEIVDVYATFEQAEAEEGASRKMQVRLDGGDWLLVEPWAANSQASSE